MTQHNNNIPYISLFLYPQYFVVVLIIVCVEIGGGIWLYMERDRIGKSVGDYFVTMIQEKYSVDVSIQLLVDYTQRRVTLHASI